MRCLVQHFNLALQVSWFHSSSGVSTYQLLICLFHFGNFSCYSFKDPFPLCLRHKVQDHCLQAHSFLVGLQHQLGPIIELKDLSFGSWALFWEAWLHILSQCIWNHCLLPCQAKDVSTFPMQMHEFRGSKSALGSKSLQGPKLLLLLSYISPLVPF